MQSKSDVALPAHIYYTAALGVIYPAFKEWFIAHAHKGNAY